MSARDNFLTPMERYKIALDRLRAAKKRAKGELLADFDHRMCVVRLKITALAVGGML